MTSNKTSGRARQRTAAEIATSAAGPRALPALQRTRNKRAPSVCQARTDAGLDIVAVRRASSPMVEMRLRVPFGGSGVDHPAKAELLAETILLGTSRHDRRQVDSALAAVGGDLTANVNPQRLLVTGSVLAAGLDVLLDVLAECLTDAAYRTGDVVREREKLVEHLAIASAQPAVIARRHLQYRRFGDHPAVLEMPDADSVQHVSAAAVRGLHRRAVLPGGSLLVLVGDLRPADAVDRALTRMASWEGARPARPLRTPPEMSGGALQVFHRPGSVQAQVRLSAPGVLRSEPDYAAAHLANIVFGGYFSSRLVENLREDKGFTYHATSAMEAWPGRGAIGIGFDTATDALAAAVVETRYELGRIVTTSPTETEVDAARSYAVGVLASALASQHGYAGILASALASGLEPTWLREHRDNLMSVTTDDVATAAIRMFAPSGVTGIVVADLDAAGPALARLSDVDVVEP